MKISQLSQKMTLETSGWSDSRIEPGKFVYECLTFMAHGRVDIGYSSSEVTWKST